MKKLATSILIAMCGGAMNAQAVVDITLVSNEDDDLLEVYVRPHTDFDQVVSGITFTLRWDTISSDGLGTRQQYCAAAFSLSSTPTVVDSGSYFRTYNGFGSALLSDEGCPWFACEEHLIMTVPVIVNGGFGPFEIVEFSFLGDTASTGIIYTSGEPCLSMAIGDPQEDEAKEVLIFPNPSTSAMTIKLPAGQQMPASIDVIAADGRTTCLVHDRAGTFDVRSLTPGAYAVRAHGVLGRFVKQ